MKIKDLLCKKDISDSYDLIKKELHCVIYGGYYKIDKGIDIQCLCCGDEDLEYRGECRGGWWSCFFCRTCESLIIDYSTQAPKEHCIYLSLYKDFPEEKALTKKIDGDFEFFYGNGELESKGYFKDGEKNGLWEYYSFGELTSKGCYLKGKKEGEWEYYRYKNMIKKGFYLGGKKNGEWFYVYESGYQKHRAFSFRNARYKIINFKNGYLL